MFTSLLGPTLSKTLKIREPAKELFSENGEMSVLIETSAGDIVIDLYVERCPRTCLNFLKLCKIKYYNLCKWKVQKDLLIQTGDPPFGTKGGDSIFKLISGKASERFFEGEVRDDLRHAIAGCVSMVSTNAGLNASQFFITTRGDLDFLDGKHSLFGEVAEGMDIVSKISNTYINEETGFPLQDILVKHTIILDEGGIGDPEGLAPLIPNHSPIPTRDEILQISELTHSLPDGALQEIERLQEGRTEAERALDLARIEARSRADVLAMIGDIPDVDVKPPENVLFVCKLNPVTQAEDLELIFSQFGEVETAEVIKDPVSGDSLCYAFIEFKDKSSSEAAYFKMDNTLIDEHRIRVDFSQSVAKLKGFSALGRAGGWKELRKGTARLSENDYGPSTNSRPDRASSRARSAHDMVFDPKEIYTKHRHQERYEERERRREDLIGAAERKARELDDLFYERERAQRHVRPHSSSGSSSSDKRRRLNDDRGEYRRNARSRPGDVRETQGNRDAVEQHRHDRTSDGRFDDRARRGYDGSRDGHSRRERSPLSDGRGDFDRRGLDRHESHSNRSSSNQGRRRDYH